jgi:hypothetical protein
MPIHAKKPTNMKRQQKTSSEKGAQKFYKPTEEHRLEYHREIFESLMGKLGQIRKNIANQPITLEMWMDTLVSAAEHQLKKGSDEIRKDYISNETWSLKEMKS